MVKYLPADSEFIKAVDPDAATMAGFRPGDFVLMDLFDATVGKAGAYPRPDEVLAKRREKERIMALLEAQAERNRARDRAEAQASGTSS